MREGLLTARSSDWAKARALVAGLAIACALASVCAGGTAVGRGAPLQGGAPPWFVDEFALLTVAYWPDVKECSGCQYPVRAALAQLAASEKPVVVISVLPDTETLKNAAVLAREQFPGRPEWMNAESYADTVRSGVLPRIEVWTSQGRLLMSRALANTTGEAKRVLDEIDVLQSIASDPARQPR